MRTMWHTVSKIILLIFVMFCVGCSSGSQSDINTTLSNVDELQTELGVVVATAKPSPTSKPVSNSSTSTSFTNKYGTRTTICANSGCSNYIASSGDTNSCVSHSNKCQECGKYIDSDAIWCMNCITKSLTN